VLSDPSARTSGLRASSPIYMTALVKSGYGWLKSPINACIAGAGTSARTLQTGSATPLADHSLGLSRLNRSARHKTSPCRSTGNRYRVYHRSVGRPLTIKADSSSVSISEKDEPPGRGAITESQPLGHPRTACRYGIGSVLWPRHRASHQMLASTIATQHRILQLPSPQKPCAGKEPEAL
jgi:hypothetical protein